MSPLNTLLVLAAIAVIVLYFWRRYGFRRIWNTVSGFVAGRPIGQCRVQARLCLPVPVTISKLVCNLTRIPRPRTLASWSSDCDAGPGDLLEYRLAVMNTGQTPVPANLIKLCDHLNIPAYLDPGSGKTGIGRNGKEVEVFDLDDHHIRTLFGSGLLLGSLTLDDLPALSTWYVKYTVQVPYEDEDNHQLLGGPAPTDHGEGLSEPFVPVIPSSWMAPQPRPAPATPPASQPTPTPAASAIPTPQEPTEDWKTVDDRLKASVPEEIASKVSSEADQHLARLRGGLTRGIREKKLSFEDASKKLVEAYEDEIARASRPLGEPTPRPADNIAAQIMGPATPTTPPAEEEIESTISSDEEPSSGEPIIEIEFTDEEEPPPTTPEPTKTPRAKKPAAKTTTKSKVSKPATKKSSTTTPRTRAKATSNEAPASEEKPKRTRATQKTDKS